MIPHLDNVKQIPLLLVTLFGLMSCSEKSGEALKVMRNKAEAKLVEQAGEGEVAIALMQKQYLELKERLVRIKTLTRTFGRRATELDARGAELAAQGKTDQADRQKRMAESYRQKTKLLEQKEVAAIEELKNFAVTYEDAKADIQMLQEELAMAKSMGGLNDNLAVENPLSKRMETVKTLTENMRQKLDRAEALLDVGDIEKDI
jgi:hypothetical protein